MSAATAPTAPASGMSQGATGSRPSSKADSAASSGVSEAGRRCGMCMADGGLCSVIIATIRIRASLASRRLLLRIREEQLLAFDPVVGDGGLPLRRQQPVDEGLAKILFDRGVFLRIDQDDAILVEQPLVALDGDIQIAAVLERYPGAAVRQHIGIHRRRGVQRRAHALPDVAIPQAFLAIDLD